jgi:hypothetical protein
MDDIHDRIEKLKREAAALNGGRMVAGTRPDCPPRIEEEFWKNVLAFEIAGGPAVRRAGAIGP